MKAPTPAAVRGALKHYLFRTSGESNAVCADARCPYDILRDHISAVASNLRSEAIGSADSDWEATAVVDMLRRFADRLEGKA